MLSTTDNISTPLSSLGSDDMDVSSLDLATPTVKTPTDLVPKNSFASPKRPIDTKSQNRKQSIDTPRNFEKELKVGSTSTPLIEIHQRKSAVEPNAVIMNESMSLTFINDAVDMNNNTAPATEVASIVDNNLRKTSNHELDSTQNEISPSKTQQIDVVAINLNKNQNNATRSDIDEQNLTAQPNNINDAGGDEELIASVDARTSSVIPSNLNMASEGFKLATSTISQPRTTSKSTKKSTTKSKSSQKKDHVVLSGSELIANDMGKRILLILFNQF